MKEFVLAGHFYLPPGLDPWTGLRSDLSSERKGRTQWKKLLNECYGANSASRVLGEHGKVRSIVNNYTYMTFSFSPFLLDELAGEAPNVYRRVQQADRESLETWGHGNALAQLPHSVILPLVRPQDLELQLDWALQAFQHHFGRKPEGMILPEHAISFPVVDALIERGIRFILLSPWQVHGLLKRGEASWTDLGNSGAPQDRPFAIDRPSGTLAVFFPQTSLSTGMAGGHLLKDALELAHQIRQIADQNEGPLVSASVDGRWFGFWEPFGDMCLAALWEHLSQTVHLQLSNYGAILERHPPQELVKLKRGHEDLGCSSTCSHGVERWRGVCGCAELSQEGEAPTWKTPLRQVMTKLQDTLDECVTQALEDLQWPLEQDFRRFVAELRWPSHSQPQLSDRTPEEQFLFHTAKEIVLGEQALLSNVLFEGSSPTHPQALEVWAQTAHTLDLMTDLTAQDVEFNFLEDLSLTPVPGYLSGEDFFRQIVLPEKKDATYPAALFLLDHFVQTHLEDEVVLGNYRLDSLDQAKEQIAEKVFRYSGRVKFTEISRLQTWEFHYALVEDLQEGVSLFLRPTQDQNPPQAFDLTKLPQGERDQIIGMLSGDLENLLAEATETLFPLLRKSLVYSKLLGSEPLSVTKALVGLVVNRRLAKAITVGLPHQSEEVLRQLEQEFGFAREFEIPLEDARLQVQVSRWLAETLSGPLHFLSSDTLEYISKVLGLMTQNQLKPQSTVAQTLAYEALTGIGLELADQLDSQQWEVLPRLRNLIRLGELLNLETQVLQKRILHLPPT